MMKILHSGTLDIKYGGPALSTYLTIKGLQANQVNAEMLMAPLTNKKDLIANDVKIHYTSPTLETRFGYIPYLKTSLEICPYMIYTIYKGYGYILDTELQILPEKEKALCHYIKGDALSAGLSAL